MECSLYGFFLPVCAFRSPPCFWDIQRHGKREKRGGRRVSIFRALHSGAPWGEERGLERLLTLRLGRRVSNLLP
jgi:hypothetical protein